MQTFQPYCQITTHCDHGANVGSVTDRRYFCYYIEKPTNVQQVGGDMILSPGWGGVLYKLGTNIYMQSPTYFCPNNPQNTFSPGNIKNYSNCKKALVDTNIEMTIIDESNNKSIIPFKIHNELDYMEITVCHFQIRKDPR